MTDATTEQDLNRAQDVILGEMPTIESPPDPIVHLPRGLRRNDGQWDTVAEVRELNGFDEEHLAKYQDTNEYYDNLIAIGTTRIGDRDFANVSPVERRAELAGLLIGEREMLAIAIARMTYGDRKTFTMTCPPAVGGCGGKFEFDLLLSEDIKFKEVTDPQSFTYSFTTKTGHVISYRAQTGRDLSEAVALKGTDAERNTLLIARAITMVDGNVLADPMRYAQGLGMHDRQRLLTAFSEHQPSPNMMLDIPCAICKEVRPFTFAWWDFFRP